MDRRNVLRAGGALLAGALAAGAAGAAAPVAAGAATPRWSRLRGQLTGDLVLPGDAAYSLAKQTEIAAFDSINPAAIVYCETPEDVRATIRFATYNGLAARTRSGGHNFAGWSTGEGVIIDVSRFNQAQVTGSTVHIGPGTQGIDALTKLGPLGKQLAAGTCPTVRAGGWLTGGGVGFQTRTFGVGSDRLVSALIALADGRVVRASATEYPDLFWAIRGGGGGNFGIVLDFEVTPINAPRMVYYNLAWSWDDAPAFLTAWQQWSVAAPRTLSSQVIAVLPDAAPGTAPIVLMQGAYFGPQASLETALAELASEAGAQPVSSTVLDKPYTEAMLNVYGCADLSTDQCQRVGTNPEATIARAGWQRLRTRLSSRPFTAGEVNAVLAAFDADRRPGNTRYLSFTGLGGAANDPSPWATAYVHRTTEFQVGYGVAIANPRPDAADAQAASAWTDRGFNVINPLSNGESYINFPDMSLTDWQRSYYGGNYARLLMVKAKYDPYSFFNHPRSIGS
ncbi:FAD-dependent oxidoreductase [Micromonospora sp. DT31]|uniref:FAD-dependent oxidoreductase n=1 Tax=Micromonospora sp. DT31 TaxID=3393434 RepID=UPI003CE7062D